MFECSLRSQQLGYTLVLDAEVKTGLWDPEGSDRMKLQNCTPKNILNLRIKTAPVTAWAEASECIAFAYICISGAETRHIPLNLLQLWQAQLLPRSSDYFWEGAEELCGTRCTVGLYYTQWGSYTVATQRNNFNIFKGGSVSWAFTTGKIVCVHLQPYPIKNQCKNKFKKTILVNSCTCVDDMGD